MSRKTKKCSGCGIALQSEDKNKAGYLPQSVLEATAHPICQRCFKISNYGAYMPVAFDDKDYLNEVKSVLKGMDIVIFVVDIIDFEGSFDDSIIEMIKGKKIIMAVNKIDLIPGEKHPSEVSEWLKVRLFKKNINAVDIAILSTKKKYGVNGVIRKLKHFLPYGGKAAVVGTTNVGKSSLINGMFGEDKVTVSKYPGTTLKVVKHLIPKTEIELYDTPGIIPKGRISDMVCEECNLKIVPSKEISRKTFKLPAGRVLLFGSLVKIKILTDYEIKPIFTAYASKDVKFHETSEEKVEEIIQKHTGELLSVPCKSCKDDYLALESKTEIYEVEEFEELVIKGLGWLTVKRGPLKVEVTLPKDAEVVIRDAFIEPRREGMKEDDFDF